MNQGVQNIIILVASKNTFCSKAQKLYHISLKICLGMEADW